MDRTLSQAFDMLRFPMAVLVIFLHIDNAPHIAVTEYNWGNQISQSIYYFSIISINIIAKVAVPCFFFISGYLFFVNQKFTFKIYVDKIKRRLHSLFIPYILWNIIAMAYLYLTQNIIKEPFYTNFTDPVNFPLWFLRDLIIIVILTPIIYGLIKYLKIVGLIMMTILYIGEIIPTIWFCYFSSIFFFYLGAYCGIRGFIPQQKKYQLLLYIATAILLAVTILEYGKNIDTYLLSIFLIIGVFASICFSYQLVEKGVSVVPILASSSFFIYVSHKIGFTFIAKFLFNIFPQGYCTMTLRFLVAPFIAAALCVVVYALWCKYNPCTLSILTGRK